jgi:hypothetical protein
MRALESSSTAETLNEHRALEGLAPVKGADVVPEPETTGSDDAKRPDPLCCIHCGEQHWGTCPVVEPLEDDLD